MSADVKFLDGHKTYIVALVCFVYGILAITKVLPDPSHIGIWSVQVAGYATGFRSCATKLVGAMGSLIPASVTNVVAAPPDTAAPAKK